MSGFITLMKREFMVYFYSPMAYAIMAVFMLLSGFLFLSSLLVRQDAGIMREFLSSLSILTLIISPMITMRLFAEEKKSGTIEMLMTAPVRDAAIVLAKFTAAVFFYLLIISPTVSYIIILKVYGNPDFGSIISGYIGLICTTMVFFSVGICVSAVTNNQIVCAVVTFIILMALLMMDFLANYTSGTLRQILDYADFKTHMVSFAKGLIDTRDIVFFLSTSAFFLFVTIKAVESRRWK